MRSLIIVLAILSMMLISPAQNRATAQSSPPVLAFYYAWFDEHTWTSGQAAGTPSPTYRSTDPVTIERHVNQAKNAGIEAFVQSWYGPQIENNQTETNFRLLLDSAAQHNFQAAVDVEVMGPFFPDRASVQAGLATLMATHVHHPAYLRFQGKPVIFFWRQERFSTAEWAVIRGVIDPNHTTYWIAEGVDLSYQDVFDGHHLYSIAWANDPQVELNKWPARLKKIEDRLESDKLWIATVMPGYNDLRLGRPNSFNRPRNGGEFYRQTWQAAQATKPDLIIVNSFNEWFEGSQIEPSTTYGDFYLNLSRELIQNYAQSVEDSLPPAAASTEAKASTPTRQAVPTPLNLLEPQIYSDTYVVQSGDNLYDIGQALRLSTQTLIDLNNLENPDFLKPGQILFLTEVEAETSPNTQDADVTTKYSVKPGDTLYHIAIRYNITVDDIIQVNRITTSAILRIGQELIIPVEDNQPETRN